MHKISSTVLQLIEFDSPKLADQTRRMKQYHALKFEIVRPVKSMEMALLCFFSFFSPE